MCPQPKPPGRSRRLRLLSGALACLLCVSCATVEKIGRQVTPSGGAQPEITIEGVSGALQENVRVHLSLAAESCDAPRWRVEHLFEQADAEAKRALRAFGYYRARLKKNLHWAQPCWSADMHIDPGPRVRVTRVEIRVSGQARSDPAFRRLLGKLPIREGDPLNQGSYEQVKKRIESLAAERGYFDGHFTTHELRVDPEHESASVLLDYDSGARYRVGQVRLHQDALDPGLVRRFIDIKAGDPYDSSRIAALSTALNDSGYFSRVEVAPRFQEAKQGSIPVDINLEPRKEHAYKFGAGLSTDTGPRGSVSYANRRLNRHGHRLQMHATASLVDRDIGAAYRIPLADPRTEWLSLQAGYKQQVSGTVKSDAFKVGANRTDSLPSGWLETRFVEFSREHSTLGLTHRIDTLLVPGISFSRTKADNPITPRHGWHARVDVRGSNQLLGSDAAFMRVSGSGKWIDTLPWGDRVIARTDLGATAVGQVDNLPASLRFFAGGDNSVRGYGYQDLGPKDGSGQVVGGRFLLVGSLEYEHLFTEHWGVATFIDSGNAFNNFSEGLKTGVGVGLRWHSPIGPVRLDFAFPVDKSGSFFRIHISMGPDL